MATIKKKRVTIETSAIEETDVYLHELTDTGVIISVNEEDTKVFIPFHAITKIEGV